MAHRSWIAGSALAAIALYAAPAAALDGCTGQYSAALIRALPAPLAVALDVRDSTPSNTASVERFRQGMADAGHPVPASPNAALTISYRITGRSSGSNMVVRDSPSGAWTEPTANNAAWMRGGQTAALPGMPENGFLRQRTQGQPTQTLFLRAEVRAVGSEQVAWVGTVQCTLQGDDDQTLAFQLGRLVGGAIGKRVNRDPV